MVDVQQNAQYGWLPSDNTVLISALAAATVATSSVLLWRCQRATPLEDTATPSTLRTTLPFFRLPGFLNPMGNEVHLEVVSEDVPLDVIQQRGDQNTKGKPPRSKERRRRSKDPFKVFSKGGKKYNEQLRQVSRPSAVPNGDSIAATTGQGYPPQPPRNGGSSNVPASSPSRVDEFTLNQSHGVDTGPELFDKSFGEVASLFPADNTNLAANVMHQEPKDEFPPSQAAEVAFSDTSSASGEPNAPSRGTSSEAPTGHLPIPSCGSRSDTEASCSSSNTSFPCLRSEGGLHLRITGCPSDWSGQPSSSNKHSTRFAESRASNSRRGSSSTICSPVTSVPEIPPALSGTFAPCIKSPTSRDAAPPALTSRVSVSVQCPPTPPLPPTPPPKSLSAQTQIASLRGALEAARLREQKSRAEAERRAQDYDALSWRWTEEAARWHRREAELHAHIQYLTLALQVHVGSPPFSPTTVPVFPAFVAPPVPCVIPSTMSHHSYSSPLDRTRGWRRKRVQVDEKISDSDLGIFSFNDRVAGAILKRPENLNRETQRHPTSSDEGPLRFPSLSDLGNVWHDGETVTGSLNKVPPYGAATEVGEGGREIEGVPREHI